MSKVEMFTLDHYSLANTEAKQFPFSLVTAERICSTIESIGQKIQEFCG